MQSKTARSPLTLRVWALSTSWRWLLLAVVLISPSCTGGGLNKVSGKVLYDGQPIKNAVVTFHPKSGDNNALRPTGNTDDNGVFTLSTQNAAGAPAGEYNVTVQWYDQGDEAGDKTGKLPEGIRPRVDRLKGKYADADKSGLTAIIKSGTQELQPFELKKVD